MRAVTSIAQLPTGPAVYALCGGRGKPSVAYVGAAGNLRTRIEQHLIRRDSSITTGVSAVALNPDVITEVRWWTHSSFADRVRLEAAELVAFDVLEPTLRSRRDALEGARALHADADFRESIRDLFRSNPSGQLTIPTLHDALSWIAELEERVKALEARLDGK